MKSLDIDLDDSHYKDKNLELIIKNEPWTIKILNNDKSRPYFSTCLLTKTVEINYMDIDYVKRITWMNYHE